MRLEDEIKRFDIAIERKAWSIRREARERERQRSISTI
jgi:hypothetical protein